MRNIIMGAEFVMSAITHFYTLAALSYVQGPPIPPWTPWFDDSYYINIGGTGGVDGTLLLNPGRAVPDPARCNVTPGTYTGLDGIWDNVVLDYVTALKYRRDAANVSALLGGRTPQIQNGCIVGGATHEASSSDIALVKSTMGSIRDFISTHQVPLTQIVSYLYGPYGGSTSGNPNRVYDNDHTNPRSGAGAGSATGIGANRVFAWGAFDQDMAGGDNPNRFLPRGCYEWNGSSMAAVLTPATQWANLKEYIDSSRYDNDSVPVTAGGHGDATKAAAARNPSVGYTKPNFASSGSYSWAKSPRMDGKACQVGPLARMAINGEINGSGPTEYFSYKIGDYKPIRITDHPYLATILVANLGTVTGAFGDFTSLSPTGMFCGFSTMDRHRARAYEALKIAHAIADTGGWADELSAATGNAYATWTAPSATGGTASGYGAHEAPRGALAHFVEVTAGKISNYQCVVPTTWNVNPKTTNTTPAQNGPIESAIIGISVSNVQSATHTVAVEAIRVVQGFDPCIACTVH